MDKVAAFAAPLLNGYMPGTAVTPTGPMPIVAMGLMQQDSVVISFCNMYLQMKRSEGLDKVKLAASYTNTVTGNKFDNHFQMLNETLEFSERSVDINKMSGSDLDKAKAFAPALNSYFGSINTYNESLGRSDIEAFKGRAKNEAEINDVINNSSRIAILNSMQNKCTANSEDKTSDQLNNYTYLTERRDSYESDLNYLLDKMNNMSIKFSKDVSEAKTFQKDISVLWSSATLGHDEKEELITGTKGKEKKYKKYQVWRVLKNDENKVNEFDISYTKKWENYIKSVYMDDSFGFLDDRRTRIQKDFYDYSFECRDSKLMETFDPDGKFTDKDWASSQTEIATIRLGCIEEEAKKKRELKNLFHDYVMLYWSANKKKKELDAQIWTLDSRFRGVFRGVTGDKDPLTGAAAEVVVCADNPNTIEQLTISNKNRMLLADISQKLMEIKIKKKIDRDIEKSRALEASEANERKRMLEIEADKKVAPEPIESSISKPRL